jgi:hypothetical protein
MPMRKLLAIVALLCGAVSVNAAEPQKWCFETSELVMSDPPVIKTPGTVDEQFDDTWPEQLVRATLSYSDEVNGSETVPVMVYNDRVFWPCSSERP